MLLLILQLAKIVKLILPVELSFSIHNQRKKLRVKLKKLHDLNISLVIYNVKDNRQQEISLFYLVSDFWNPRNEIIIKKKTRIDELILCWCRSNISFLSSFPYLWSISTTCYFCKSFFAHSSSQAIFKVWIFRDSFVLCYRAFSHSPNRHERQ